MKKNITIGFIIIFSLSIIIAPYIKKKIIQNEIKEEQLLVMKLNQEAEKYLNTFIIAIENGDYIKISEMTRSNPENYKKYENNKFKFLKKKVDREILYVNNTEPVYILKFQPNEEIKSGINQDFSFINGFHYMTVRLLKHGDGWIVTFTENREYIN